MKSKLLLLSAFSTLFTVACVNETNTPSQVALDSSAGTIAYESNAMGDDAALVLAPATLGRVSAGSLQATFTYDSTSGKYIRSASGTGTAGWSGTRNDTLAFFDAQGNILTSPQLATLDHYTHTRSVSVTRDNHNYEGSYKMSVQVNKGASDTTFTFNGNVDGTFDSEYTRNVSIENVVRKVVRTPQFLARPTSGKIHIERPLRLIDIQFSETGATGVVTNKANQETRNFSVDETTGTVTLK